MGNALHGRDGMSTGGAGRWGRSGTVGRDGEVGHKQATQGGGGENGGLAQERKQEKKKKRSEPLFLCNQWYDWVILRTRQISKNSEHLRGAPRNPWI